MKAALPALLIFCTIMFEEKSLLAQNCRKFLHGVLKHRWDNACCDWDGQMPLQDCAIAQSLSIRFDHFLDY